MEQFVKVERWKSIPYIINIPTPSGANRKWTFESSKNGKPSLTNLPLYAYEWTTAHTRAFDLGELRLSNNQEKVEELEMHISNVEQYKNNSHTKDEIVNLLKKNGLPKIRKELELITVKSEKQFVYEIFEEIKTDLIGSKIELVEKWYNDSEDNKIK